MTILSDRYYFCFAKESTEAEMENNVLKTIDQTYSCEPGSFHLCVYMCIWGRGEEKEREMDLFYVNH